ncbi:hypothetical protein PHMEG_0003740 [Phytophthora megakarya]|uniref:Uncharacterized protein n=1 Tax=Phytophthora megakarya TaxID=4795 RepID=A0A225WXZ0_9STRA|nr:hypothetical protein PHMEG_0003740 [Phytophthora megakarya]
MGLDFVLDTMANIVNVLCIPSLRLYNAATKRLETDNQPATGWPVDMASCTCSCVYFYNYASYVHLLFAMQRSTVLNGKGEEVLSTAVERQSQTLMTLASRQQRLDDLDVLDLHWK